MSEKVVGNFLLDGQNEISIPKGSYEFVGNEMGGVLIDSQTKPNPQVWGKEAIWLLDQNGNPVRKRTLELNESVVIVLAGKDGATPYTVGTVRFIRE